MNEINERLKAARKALNLSQKEFAQRIGVTDSAISFIEKGERNLTDRTILAVCREYGVNEAWLRTGEGGMFAAPAKAAVMAAADGLAPDDPIRKLLETYALLPERCRQTIREFIDKWVDSIAEGAADDGGPSIEEQADAFAAIAREQFIKEKTAASPPPSASGSETA